MLNLKELIAKNKFDWTNSDITEENFPDDGRRGRVELIDFKKYISTENALKELDEKGYRPATLYELLEWKRWNGKDFVVALGSVWRLRDGHRGVPFLARGGSERSLGLRWTDVDWHGACRFASCRKELSPKTSEPLVLSLVRLEKLYEELGEIIKELK